MIKQIARLVLLCSLVLVVPAVASAHASLVRSDPAANSVLAKAPARVQLWFDEGVDPHFSKIEVFDPARVRVDTGQLAAAPGDDKSLVQPLGSIGRGTFAVSWQAMSADDGHITNGVFSFTVGEASGSSSPPAAAGSVEELSPLSALVRWLELFGLLALLGGILFRLLLLDPSLEAIFSRDRAKDSANAAAIGRARWRTATLVFAGLALVAGTTDLVLQVIPAAGSIGPESVLNVLLSTRVGVLGLVRLLLVIAAALSVLLARHIQPLLIPGAVLAALALLTRSLSSHAAAVQGDFSLGVFSDWLHLSAVSIWVGGLACLTLLVPTMWRYLAPTVRSRWIATVVSRFSIVGLTATPIIALTGVYNATLQVPSLDALTGTGYGQTLLFKVALFGVMLLFGASNLLLISPRLRAAIAAPVRSGRIVSRFRLTLAAEALLSLAVILLAGLLTLEPPARSQTASNSLGPAARARVFLAGDAAPGVRVQLVIGPTPDAPTEFDARIIDSNQKPATGISSVAFDFSPLNADTAVQEIAATAAGDGHFLARGDYLLRAGLWLMRVTVRRDAQPDASVEFPYRILQHAARPASDPLALHLIAESEAAMNRLHTLRSDQYLNDGANGESVTHFDYQAPDKMRFTVEGQGESIAVGPVQYYRDLNGSWTQQGRVDPFVFPNFDTAREAAWGAMGRDDTVRGVPAQVVLFSIPNSSASADIDYAYWVSKQDRRLLQLAMVTDGHYMIQTYFDANAGDIDIQPPTASSSGGAAAASATPAPAPAAAPLTGNRRPRGLITGDLEADGGLILLVVAIAASVTGLAGRGSRSLRLGLLAIGLACGAAGLGLFVDALNSAATGRGAVTVDAALAAAGQPHYKEYCSDCHGAEGRGDGPRGASLPVKPFDLTTHVLQHDETYLYSIILNGRGYMPPFGDRLTQDEIVQVIAYIRRLALDARR